MHYTLSLALIAFMVGATAITHASEVTGTLSSDASGDSTNNGNISGAVSNDSDTDGDIAGTVVGNEAGGNTLRGTVSSRSTGGSSGSSRSSGSISTDSQSGSLTEPAGAVLGQAASAPRAPAFPNAGAAPTTHSTDQPLWSIIVTFLKSILSF